MRHLAKAYSSVRPGTIRFPGVYFWPGIRFKTTAVILAVVQLLLSCNTCRGILLLRPNNCSWPLHLPGKFALAGSKSQGRILLTGETLFRRCYKPNHTFDTCWGIFESFTATVTKSEKSLLVSISNEKVKMQYFLLWKVKNCYFFT